MYNIFKFPNGGFDVKVCRKQDILDSLGDDIDKELLLTIVTQCETDAINFINEGRWTGIPYLGNMRVPKNKQKFEEIGGREILETARQELDKKQYDAFKRDLNASIVIDIKKERLYRYMTSCFVTKNRKVYDRFLSYATTLSINNVDAYARFMCYSCIELTPCITIE